MKRRNIVILIMVALVIGLMGSCDALFENQFKLAGLGQITAEDLVDSDANTLLEESGFGDGEVSQSFIDAALADADTQAAVIATLQDAADAPGATPEVVQGASALIIEIELQAAGADQVVDNLLGVVGVATAEGFDPTTDMGSIIDALIPAGLDLTNTDDQAELAAMFDALAGLTGTMDTIAASIDADGLSEGVDAGSLAQTAIMATVLDALVPAGELTVGEALVAALADDPANFGLYVTLPDGTLDGLTSDATLLTLLEAAGLSFPGA